MGEGSNISWTDNTFNPWMGCQRISPACEHCYAETLVTGRMGYNLGATDEKKRLRLWGPPSTSTRRRTSAALWKQPLAWDRAAKRDGVRRKVFCASLADVFEEHPELDAIRADLWPLIEKCTSLDWQLLTKRPWNVAMMAPASWFTSWPSNVCIGTTVESRRTRDERVPHLLQIPARVRFLSMEPLLEEVDLEAAFCVCDRNGEPSGPRCNRDGSPAISWVIVGGESGPGARPFDLAWSRSIVAQCREAGVPAFVKQVGSQPVDSSRAAVYQPCRHEGRPAIRTTIYAADAPEVDAAREASRDQLVLLTKPQVECPLYLRGHYRFDDRAGADPREWPADLRVQEFPR
jgi:protein gp37